MSDDLLGGTTRARAAPAAPHVDFGADLDTGADAQDGGGGDPPADDLLSKKKVQQKRLTFKEAHLISEKGMWRLYEQMQRLPISRREGDEVRRAACSPTARTNAACLRDTPLTRLSPAPAPANPPTRLRLRTCC